MTDVGDLIRFGNPDVGATVVSAPFTTIDGTPTNPTAVTLIVLKPDGTTLLYAWPSSGFDGTLANESAGRFYAEILIDQSGKWQWRIQGTGAVTAAAEGSLRVQRQRVTA
jgi:hypothetical protein